MKRCLCAFLLLAILLCVTGCINIPQNDALVVCGTHAVPGFYLRDLKGYTYTCNILDTDSNGRILYEFSTLNILSGQIETAVVICQARDRKHVFYYEDLCYLLPGYEDSDITELKKENDWDNALDFSKMSQREIHVSIDSYILSSGTLLTQKVCNACSTAIGFDTVAPQELLFIDADGYGNELYFFTTNEHDEKYFAILSADYNVSVFCVQGQTLDIPAYLNFKKSSGWCYPID